MIPEIVDMIQKSAAIAVGLALLNVVTAFLMRMYLTWAVIRKKQVDLHVRPTQKQWVNYVAPLQDVEFKGLVVMIVVIVLIAYFIKQIPAASGLIVILVGLSFFTFTLGLARPSYYLTPEGLVVLNWYPPYMNRNMGFFRWSLFEKYAATDDGVVVGSPKRIIPIICEQKDLDAVRRYVRRMMNRLRAEAGLETLD